MSTPNITPNQPLNQPGQQPPAQQAQPPVPQNPNDMTPEQVRQHAAGTQPAPVPVQQPTTAPPTQVPGLPPIERGTDGMLSMRLPTGQVYKGASEWELLAQVASGQVNASARITELSTEAERLRNGLAAVTGQPVGNGAAPAQQFDRAVYMELQAQDPILAMNYLDQHRFGLNNINDVIPYYTRTAQAADEFRTAQTVSQFRLLAPDFPGTQQAVDAVMGYMKQHGIPFSAPNLHMVHQAMVTAHAQNPAVGYAPLQITMPGQQPQPQMPQPGNPQPGQPTQPQIDLRMYDPSPQGNYSFGPGGFGTSYPAQPAAPTAPTPAQPTVVAPPPVQVPTVQYPPIPQRAQPLPMPTVTPTAAPSGQASEAQVNEMDTATLRRYIESNLPR